MASSVFKSRHQSRVRVAAQDLFEAPVLSANIEECLQKYVRGKSANSGTDSSVHAVKPLHSGGIFEPANYLPSALGNKLLVDIKRGFLSIQLPDTDETDRKLEEVNQAIRDELEKIPLLPEEHPLREFQFKTNANRVIEEKDLRFEGIDEDVAVLFLLLELFKRFTNPGLVPAIMQMGQMISAAPNSAGYQLFEVHAANPDSALGQTMQEAPHRIPLSHPKFVHSALVFKSDGAVVFEQVMESYALQKDDTSGLTINADGSCQVDTLSECYPRNKQGSGNPLVTVTHAYTLPSTARADLIGVTEGPPSLGATHEMAVLTHPDLDLKIRDQYLKAGNGYESLFTALEEGGVGVDIYKDILVPAEPTASETDTVKQREQPLSVSRPPPGKQAADGSSTEKLPTQTDGATPKGRASRRHSR